MSNRQASSEVAYDTWSWIWTCIWIAAFIFFISLWPGLFWWWFWIFLFIIIFDSCFWYWPSSVYVEDGAVHHKNHGRHKQYQLSQVASVEVPDKKRGKNGYVILHMKDGSTTEIQCKDPLTIADAVKNNLQ